MRDVQELLEAIRVRAVRTPEDAEVAEEATRLLGEILAVKRRAVRFVEEVEGGTEAKGSSGLAGLTLHEAARRVLREAGTPLHARELGARIKAGGWRHPRAARARPDQIVFQLAARLPRHANIFRRVGPNTFALVEWGSEPFKPKGRTPSLGLFTGSGSSIGRLTGESDEPFHEAGAWRSS